MISLNVPKQIFIEISDDWILIKGPLGSKKKKKIYKFAINFW